MEWLTTSNYTSQILITIFVALSVNLVSGVLDRFWAKGHTVLDHGFVARKKVTSPGRGVELGARALAKATRYVGAQPGSTTNFLERLITRLMRGSDHAVAIVNEEVDDLDLTYEQHLELLIANLVRAAAIRLGSPIGQFAGVLIGLGTLTLAPLHFTNHPLDGPSAVEGLEAVAGVGYMLITLGMIGLTMAFRQDRTLGPSRALRLSVIFLNLGLPAAIVSLAYISVVDVFTAIGMGVCQVGAICLVVQAHVKVSDLVRRIGLTSIGIGCLAVALSDLYWVHFGLSTGAYVWAGGLSLVVIGTLGISLAASLTTQIEAVRS